MPKNVKTNSDRKILNAAKHKQFDEIQKLLDVENEKLSNAILAEVFVRCALSKNIRLVESLLDLGVHIDVNWNGYTALSTIAGLGDARYVNEFLKRGAGVDTPGFDQGSPLIQCAKVGLEWNDPEIRRHSISVAKTLIAHGAKVNATDMYHKTALDYSFQGGWTDLARLLISAGAEIRRCEDGGSMLLFHAVSQPGSVSLLRLYLKGGGDPRVQIAENVTALDHAKRAGWTEKSRLLENALKKTRS